MKYIALLFVAFCAGFQTTAVAQIPYYDSREVILKGVAMYDTGNYKGALEQYRLVNECDTNYSIALYEAINALIADSSYREAKKEAQFAVTLNNGKKRDFALQLGNACDYLEETDSALAIYRELMEQYPTDQQPYYETGVVYFRKLKYDLALSFFERSAVIDPNHSQTHYMIGRIYAMQGRLAEALMAFETTLLVTKNTALAKKAIAFIAAITEQTDEIRKYYTDKDDKYRNPLFDDIDQVINAKIALNASYKLKIDINDNIFRQSQAMMEKLKFDAADTGFSMQYYLPMFENVYKNDLFEGCMLLAYSEFGLDVVDELAKKKKSEIDEARKIVFPYLSKIQSTREVNYNRRQKAQERYHYLNSSQIILIGNVVEKGDESIVVGDGIIYRTEHTLYAKGKYNAKGQKNGLWKYYYATGILMKEENYTDGDLTGMVKEYYKNGNPEKYTTYNSKSVAISQDEFSYSGRLNTRRKLMGDNEVEETSYFQNGTVQMTISTIKNEVKEGTYKTYYDNGKLNKVTSFKFGKLQGEYRKYYPNGQVSEAGNYEAGKLEGPYTEYYESGAVSKKYAFSGGKLEGVYEEFYENGKLSLSTVYSRNKKKGINKEFDHQGRLYEEISMNDYVPNSIKCYDSTGKVIYEKADPNGVREYSLFDEYGRKVVDNRISDEGMRDGLVVFYYPSGLKSNEFNFLKGDKNGRCVSYFKNGKVKLEEEFTEGVNDGYYKHYFLNGTLSEEGWYKKGKKQGPWKTYLIDGTLKNELFYLNDYMCGYSKNYDQKGRLMDKLIFDYDLMVAAVFYDTLERKIDSISFPGGNGRYRSPDRFHQNFTDMEFDVKYGDLQGPIASKFYTGKILETGVYHDGKKDSTSIYLYPDGTTKYKGAFANGYKTGLCEYYNEVGELVHAENILNGVSNGITKSYACNTLRIAYNYKADDRDSDQVYYGDDNKIAVILKYNAGELKGYTYMGKDGQLVSMIPLKNGTGKITAYYPNGKVSAEMNAEQDNLEGSQKLWFSNGQIAEERNYKNFLFEGPFKRYNPDGKVVNELTYKNGEEMGKELTYDKNGNLIISREYYMGTEHGQTIVKNPASNKTKVYTYYCGDLMNITE